MRVYSGAEGRRHSYWTWFCVEIAENPHDSGSKAVWNEGPAISIIISKSLD